MQVLPKNSKQTLTLPFFLAKSFFPPEEGLARSI